MKGGTKQPAWGPIWNLGNFYLAKLANSLLTVTIIPLLVGGKKENSGRHFVTILEVTLGYFAADFCLMLL